MGCPGCGFENLEAARFCGGCGGSLATEVTCAGCGADNPPSHRFCHGCGAQLGDGAQPPAAAERDPRGYTPKHLADKILQSRTALEGERKHVTVLFADVKGSMELAEQLGAEEWHRILERFFQILTEGVHRFEGTVNQYTGDGIMALFGAPIAHEDHAQRACYAALWLRDSLKEYADALRVEKGLNFSVRMGLNSGEVVVGKIGDDLRMDYTAQGHTVGLAQRMEALAEAGKALLASHTLDLVEGYFELRDLGETRVPGVEAPVRIAELEGVGRMRTRLDRSRARGLSRFVGRDEEMERLEAALEHALAGDGQVVGIVAEAGAGKSRVCHEFAERCRDRGIAVRSSTGVPHGLAVPLQPVLEFYREIFGLQPEEGQAESRQKIAGLVAQIAPELLDSLPLLFEFMRVPDSTQPAPDQPPEERRSATLDLLRRLTLARSRRQAAVLIFEDLHWIDPETEQVVEMMVDAAASARTLLVTNSRPEYRAPWTGRTHYQQLALRPLDAEAAGELLADWLGPDPSLAGFAERVRDRTGGNPFFMEEVVQAQIDGGTLVGTRGRFRLDRPIDEIDVPESVQSLLAARIDRLRDETKRLLQTAAVVGDEVPEALLADVAGLAPDAFRGELRELVQGEFVYEQSLYPELEYAFKHPLTREVAYGSLLAGRRRELHAGAAKAIEARAGDAADAQAALLAHHWEQAGRALEAAHWQTRAALQLGMGRVVEGTFHWRRVVELLEGDASPEAQQLVGDARARLIYAAARSDLPQDEVDARFEEALSAVSDPDSGARAQVLLAYAMSFVGRGHMGEARELVDRAGQIARRAEDADRLAAVLMVQMLVENESNPGRVVELNAELEDLCADDPSTGSDVLGVRPLVLSMVQMGSALLRLGRAEEAEASRSRTLEMVRDHEDPIESVLVPLVEAMRMAHRGDLTGSVDAGRLAVERSAALSNPASQASASRALALACARAGRADEAEQNLRRLIEIGLDGGSAATFASLGLSELTDLLIEQGRKSEALETAEAGLEQLAALDLPGSTARLRVARARALLATGGAEKLVAARTELDRAEAFARERGIVDLPAWALEVRAEAAALAGDPAERERALLEAARLHRLCGDDWAAERAERRRES